MSSDSSSRNDYPEKSWSDGLLICFFIVLLWLPTVDFFCGIDHSQPTGENRLPAPKPELKQLNLTGLQKFITATEAYFNDHFGFRKGLIRLCQQWKANFYQDLSGIPVIKGKNNWLFSAELKMVENYLGMAKFTPAELKSWQTLLEKRRDWLAARGIKYRFIVAPDKHTIYPEEVPDWLIKAAPQNRKTKLDQFLEYMRANSTVEILDLRPPLLAAKKTAATYLQNDTHWNLFGGFIACQEIVKNLGEQFPNLPPLKLEDFVWTNTAANGGDLARFIGLSLAEKNYFTFQPNPTLPELKTNETAAYKSNWGNKRVSSIFNSQVPEWKIVIFNDSYGRAFQKFFGYSFQKTVQEWDHHEFCQPLILSNAPNVVINEILERFFNTYDPTEMIAKDALP